MNNIKKNSVVALIPARKGSKSIRYKNIKYLNGHPLISYSIVAALNCPSIDEVFVTTDSEKIKKISKKYGAKVPFLRPKNISNDNSKDITFFNHFLNFRTKQNLFLPEFIVHLSPTCPFRDINDISSAIKKIKSIKDSTSLRSVSEAKFSPYKMFKEKNGFLSGLFKELKGEYYNSPRQSFGQTYIPNGHVDIIKTNHLLKNKNLHGNKIISFVSKRILKSTISFDVDIDSKDDFRNAKKIVYKKTFLINKKGKKFKYIKKI